MSQETRDDAVTLRYIPSDGEGLTLPLAEAKAANIAGGSPVRSFGSHARMRHYVGWWWSATTSGHVGYESLLERDRVILADFDPDVVSIASQPFGLTGTGTDVVRRHVPDFLLMRRDGSAEVVDVKPAELLDEPAVSELLSWTGRVMHAKGWRYSVWSGEDPLVVMNVRFLAQGRHRHYVDADAMKALNRHAAKGSRLGDVIKAARCGHAHTASDLRAAMICLLWHQVWRIDVSKPLSSSTTIDEIQEVAG